MEEESNLKNKIEDNDIENMKVTELKKKLKSFGLSVAGNKSELVERLQEAMISGKGVETMPGVDSTLLIDSSEISTPCTSDNPLLEDFSLSPEKDMSKETLFKSVDSTNTNSNLTTIPLKKRAVPQAAAETVKVEKKIVLKRNNIPTPKIIPSKPSMPLKTVNVIDISKMDTNDNNQDAEADKNEVIKDGKSVVCLSTAPTKSLSELEKFVLRAKRFNITAPPDKSRPDVVSTPLTTAITSNISSVSSSANLLSIEALKKRAERFGQNVSTVMKKLEDQQKVLKRKSKFGNIEAGNGISSTEEQEKKKKRAERFGL